MPIRVRKDLPWGSKEINCALRIINGILQSGIVAIDTNYIVKLSEEEKSRLRIEQMREAPFRLYSEAIERMDRNTN